MTRVGTMLLGLTLLLVAMLAGVLLRAEPATGAAQADDPPTTPADDGVTTTETDTPGTDPADTVPAETDADDTAPSDGAGSEDTVAAEDTVGEAVGEGAAIDSADTAIGTDTDPTDTDPTDTAPSESTETDDPSPGDTTTAELDEVFGETGDGADSTLTAKVDPLPGFTGGGAVRGDNPIRALGGGAFEQPVLVVGQTAARELRAGISAAESSIQSLDTTAANLATERLAAEDAATRAAERAATAQKIAAWESTFNDVSTDLVQRALTLGPLNQAIDLLQGQLVEAEAEVTAGEALLQLVRSRVAVSTDSVAVATRTVVQRRSDLVDASANEKRSSNAFDKAQRRFDGAASVVARQASELDDRETNLRKVAVAFYIGGEQLRAQAIDLSGGTESVDRREIGRVGARSIFELRDAEVTDARRILERGRAAEQAARSTQDRAATALRSAERGLLDAQNAVRSATTDLSRAENLLDRDVEALELAKDRLTTSRVAAGRARGAVRDAADQLENAEAALTAGEATATSAITEIFTLDPTRRDAESARLAELLQRVASVRASGAEVSEESESGAAVAGVSRERVFDDDAATAAAASEAVQETEDDQVLAREAAERAAALVEAEAAALERRASAAPAALRALLGSSSVTFPIAGSWNFIDSWGFPRSGGRRHKGTDIFAPRGTPLVAIEDGGVRASTNRLGGLVVYLTGESGNQYYYAHLESIHPRARAGGNVRAGDVIGYVGTSGNAAGTPPHLHIGVRAPGTGPINPYPLMRALSDGVRTELAQGSRASVPDRTLVGLSAGTIKQLVDEGTILTPQVVAQLSPGVVNELRTLGVIAAN